MFSAADNPDGDRDIGDALRLLRQCPLCHSAYQAGTMRQIAHSDEAELLHVTCHTCGGALLALFVRSPVGMSSVAALTDLSASDAERLCKHGPLTDDDVLLFHEFLTNHTRAFHRLFT